MRNIDQLAYDAVEASMTGKDLRVTMEEFHLIKTLPMRYEFRPDVETSLMDFDVIAMPDWDTAVRKAQRRHRVVEGQHMGCVHLVVSIP